MQFGNDLKGSGQQPQGFGCFKPGASISMLLHPKKARTWIDG